MELESLKLTPKKIEKLEKMKITKAEDLLFHFPFRYEELIEKPFEQWQERDKVCFEATIISAARVNRYAYKRSVTKFKVIYEEEELNISLFNRPWTSQFIMGKKIVIIGRYDGNYNVTCSNYNFQPIQEQLGIIPVYNVKENITQKEIITCIRKALEVCQLPSFIPQEYKEKYKLMSEREALIQIHMPKNKEMLKQSLRTLKYEEFLKFQMQMLSMKADNTKVLGHQKVFDEYKVKQLIQSLPYTLTQGQSEAIDDVLHDLQSERVMYRLVQGDVGCGKTLVAAVGMYACILSGAQALMMAPTEILAKQHYRNLCELFNDYDVNIGVLYSSMPPKEKSETLAKLANGELDMIVGTHALFQEDVIYHNLGLVIADEQHRFGVEQRRQLLEKGDKVDFLLMSATPIPRTLAVSLYGDMEVSTISTLPKGRKEIHSYYVKEDSLRSVLPDILERIDGGMQCYIVAPAIELNEEFKMRNVETLYENMNKVLGKKYRLALLHGKMSGEEKEDVMQKFYDHEYDFLITTTVIEVGVDVKNANIMVIYDAHRFGMSQLHQLRGRVGRGDEQGYCYFISGSKEEEAQKRLSIMETCSDGFTIAQSDLALRGPGDLLGVRQSGVSSFLLGDIIKDQAILEVARNDAIAILKNISQYPQIQRFIEKKGYTSYVD